MDRSLLGRLMSAGAALVVLGLVARCAAYAQEQRTAITVRVKKVFG